MLIMYTYKEVAAIETYEITMKNLVPTGSLQYFCTSQRKTSLLQAKNVVPKCLL